MEKYDWFKLGIQVITISLASLFFAAMLINLFVTMTRGCDPDYSICHEAKFS